MKLSSLFGKTAQSEDGKARGYIVAINVLDNKIEYFTCVDENEKEFFVDVDSVVSFDERIIFKDRASVFKRCKTVRLGRPSYSCEGKFLGHLTDFEASGANLKYAYIGGKRFCVEELFCGDAVIAKKDAKLKADVKKGDKILFKKGEKISPQMLQSAKLNGEYIQTNLKSL